MLDGDEGKDCEDVESTAADVESTAAGSEISDTWCTLCLLMKALAEMKDQSRCKLCDSLRLRIFRMNVSVSMDGKSALDRFADMAKEARATFYRENAHKFKDELRKQIDTAVKQISTSSVEFGWVGTGDLMDSPDLEKKYKHNPIRLAAIKAKARQVQCPSTDIRMYEDLKIVTHTGETNKRAREESDTTSQHRSERAAAKKKPRKVMKADADQQDDKQMSEAQLKTLGTMKEWYAEGLASLVQFNTDVEKYDEHVPNSVKTRLGEAKETVDLALAELNVAIEQAACGKAEFAQLGQNHKETNCCLRDEVESLAERREAQGRHGWGEPRHEDEEAECKDLQHDEEAMRKRRDMSWCMIAWHR